LKNVYVANTGCLSLARTRRFTPGLKARYFEVYESVVVIFSITLQGFTTAERLASLLCCINTPQLHFNPQNGISPNRCHLYDIDWTLNSSAVCVSKEKYETRTVDGHTTGSIYACHPSGWIQSGIFTLWVLCFLQT